MNRKKIIFINNPAATSGGALTILKQFITEVSHNFKEEIITYVFCTVDLNEYERDNVKIINNIKAKRGKERIIWDLSGLNKWSIKKNIKPDLIISLQNTAIRGFKGVPQIVYLHQSIPYYTNIKWNPIKKEDRIYWFYRYIYKLIIGISLKNNYVAVQTNWMRNAVLETHNLNPDKVIVTRPNVILDLKEKNLDLDETMLFYPSSGAKYKNHLVLIEALNTLVNELGLSKVKLYLTVLKEELIDERVLIKIKNYNLENNVKFLGNLESNELIEYYCKANIVLFPSYIETVGLPLLEAATLKKKIIVSDLSYSREVLGQYENAIYINCKDCSAWATAIFDNLNILSNREVKFKNSFKNGWDLLSSFIIEKVYGEINE